MVRSLIATSCVLKHYHYDVFEIHDAKLEEREANLVGAKFMLHANWDGAIEASPHECKSGGLDCALPWL